MTKFIYALVGVLIIVGGVYFLTKNDKEPAQDPSSNTTNNNSPDNSSQDTSETFSFNTPKKSAHYETNTPVHGAVLAAPPINVVIDFNFDLAAPSSISVTNNGREYAIGDLVIDRNKLSMRRNFDQSAPNGLYKVTYNACWPDKTCHDGHFEFAIDRTKQSSFLDMTGRQEVTIKMSDIKFNPSEIKINKGTKVVWLNDEDIEHYVNTDSHPAHTYYLPQNSRALKRGDSYSVTFTETGIYPYHCSAHADVMMGNIIVS